MPTPTTRRRRAGFAAALLAGTALAGFAATFRPETGYAQPAAAAPIDAARAAPAALPGFGDLVAKVRPAVVTITTTARPQQAAERGSPFPPGSEQDRMFGRYFGGRGQAAPRPSLHALGSGFVVDDAGHVVTNNHVVANATEVRVTLADGRELPARIIGRDARTDLAVLQVEAGGGAPIPHLALGDSDAVRVGDWVVAVGNPFGLGGTVTAGILSARGRDIGSGPYDDYLQVDAPINSGNSGGPLFAHDGSVVGVNTAIFSPTGGSVGIGFAIPSDLVKRVVAQLERNGTVERGYLGAMTQAVTPGLASALKLDKPDGALVAEVEQDGPAARAGLQPGDVVTALAGTAVHGPRDLARAVAEQHPGNEAKLEVRRDGGDRTLTVQIAVLKDQANGPDAAPGGPQAENGGQVGIALGALTDEARDALGLAAGSRGVVVAGIRPDSPAAEAGLRPGDVLQAVGGRTVGSPEEAVAAIRAAARTADGAVALRVLRDGQGRFVALQAPRPARAG
jgi:serine protease Do